MTLKNDRLFQFCHESVKDADVSVLGLKFGWDGRLNTGNHFTPLDSPVYNLTGKVAGWIGYSSLSVILVPARQNHVKTASG